MLGTEDCHFYHIEVWTEKFPKIRRGSSDWFCFRCSQNVPRIFSHCKPQPRRFPKEESEMRCNITSEQRFPVSSGLPLHRVLRCVNESQKRYSVRKFNEHLYVIFKDTYPRSVFFKIIMVYLLESFTSLFTLRWTQNLQFHPLPSSVNRTFAKTQSGDIKMLVSSPSSKSDHSHRTLQASCPFRA